MIELRIASCCKPTGEIFTQLLKERGIEIGRSGDAVVCYGTGYSGNKPALNAAAGGRSKLEELEILARAGIKVPITYKPVNGVLTQLGLGSTATNPKWPLLARKLNHMHGKDIMVTFQQEDVPMRVAAGAAFFTEYIPRATEYRTWIYRRRHLSTYQKVMKYPEKYRFVGCNYRNGFMFERVENAAVPAGVVDAASRAITALNLDFGAVDILQGKDGLFYVLEVNTAPGVAGLTREGIKKLADKVAKWVQLGYVARGR